MAKYKILLVEDDEAIRLAVRDYLTAGGFDVAEAGTCGAAEERFRVLRPDVVLVDYFPPDGTALDLMPRLRGVDANVPLIVLTAHASIGAEQFLTKPAESRRAAPRLTKDARTPAQPSASIGTRLTLKSYFPTQIFNSCRTTSAAG